MMALFCCQNGARLNWDKRSNRLGCIFLVHLQGHLVLCTEVGAGLHRRDNLP